LSTALYEATVPVLVRTLNKLAALLDKGLEAGLADAEMVQLRLAPDMLPFAKQVQIVSDTAKGAVARLTGTEAPSMADTETTVAELKDRIARTLSFVQSVDASAFNGAEDREVVLKFPSIEMRFSGRDYVNQFVLPNLFFHVSIAYALLRNKGVAIGKSDFLPIDLANVKMTG
jgi:hypothetical protein